MNDSLGTWCFTFSSNFHAAVNENEAFLAQELLSFKLSVFCAESCNQMKHSEPGSSQAPSSGSPHRPWEVCCVMIREGHRERRRVEHSWEVELRSLMLLCLVVSSSHWIGRPFDIILWFRRLCFGSSESLTVELRSQLAWASLNLSGSSGVRRWTHRWRVARGPSLSLASDYSRLYCYY